MPELFLESFLLRVIISWSVVEHPVLLRPEKTEIKSHRMNNFQVNTTLTYKDRKILDTFTKVIARRNKYGLSEYQKSNTVMIDIRIGNGYDVHALAPDLDLWLGGVKIESDTGCIAHSDGDVAIHALCDALLGALALGDIGKHFPDTSDEFKGIDSKILLSRTTDLIRSLGWEVGNADITIAMQRPKLAPYIQLMRETMAGVMNIDINRVSVKATTTEKLGFVGRCEGCEVYAVVLLTK